MPAIMPVFRSNSKCVPKNSCLAKDEYTGLRFRITPSAQNRKKFSKVGRPQRCDKCCPHSCSCYNYPWPRNRHTPDETRTLQLSSEEDIERLGKLASLISLRDRLSSPPPTSPLIHRINLSPPPVHIPPPIPNDIHFRKTKLLNCIKEYYVMMDATRLRLDPIAKKLIEDDERQHLGLEVKVPREVRDKTWEVIEKFNEYYEKLDTVGHKMTNKKWRLLKKAVKAIGGVSFTDLDSNLHSVCNNLLGLEIMFPPICIE
ncbi:hypothetical protein VKT23_020344 [Stygiomarasmius scandens]|uniref:Uncharacterized protein n=1 Tax=Marasmiellus scandens TaxID=2682957 RepID=A0ABR1IL04_9AGAR